jgi:hypothetical protein
MKIFTKAIEKSQEYLNIKNNNKVEFYGLLECLVKELCEYHNANIGYKLYHTNGGYEFYLVDKNKFTDDILNDDNKFGVILEYLDKRFNQESDKYLVEYPFLFNFIPRYESVFYLFQINPGKHFYPVCFDYDIVLNDINEVRGYIEKEISENLNTVNMLNGFIKYIKS